MGTHEDDPALDATRPGTAETDGGGEDAAGEAEAPEYAFEGFRVEFSEKVALLPAGAGRS